MTPTTLSLSPSSPKNKSSQDAQASGLNILWIAPYPVNPTQHPAPWILMLAREIVGAGHKLTILTPTPKIDKLQKMNTSYGYQVILLPYQGGIRHLLSLFQTQIKALRGYLHTMAEKYDVIHVHGTESEFASSLDKLHLPSPHIISIQGIITLYKKELLDKLSRRYLYWSLNSIYEKREVRRGRFFFCRTEWDQQFVRSINPRADISLCWEALRPEFFDYSHSFTGKDILFLGGDNPLKALGHCLTVYNQVARDKDIRLHIIGSVTAGAVAAFRAAGKLKNITDDNIIIHGSQDAAGICRIYQLCYCLYHPSLIDNSPNSVCEAQVAGLPVIATNVGGVSSLITDGSTGILVHKNDVDGHVGALERLLADADLKHCLSQNARAVAVPRHDKQQILDTTIGTYRKIISGQAAGAIHQRSNDVKHA